MKSNEMSSDLRMVLVSCADRRIAARGFLKDAAVVTSITTAARDRTYIERKMTSPNVVPFPPVPDRALDERFDRFADQYATILRAHIARHCPRDLGIQINDIEQ